jgi:hypothetical protein
MTAPHDASGDATPRHVLPIRGSQDANSLRDVIGSVVAEVAEDRRRRRLPHVSMTTDIGGGRAPVADAGRVRAVLRPLVAAACEAATAPGPASDGPSLHEVVITAVETHRGVEIEVADSGPGPAFLSADVVADARGHTERLGGSLIVAACPDGGTAVTVCLWSCQDQRQAIRPAA